MARAVHIVGIVLLAAVVRASELGSEAPGAPSSPGAAVGNYIAIVVLLMAAAMFSGLNLGLLGLGVNELRIVMRGDRKEEAAQAAAILPMREKGNQLLCTILLGNVAVNSMVSILMADLTNGLIGFFASTLAIVLLGEIVPQSVCSRFPLKIGAATLPLFKIIFYIMWPVTKPVAWLLDKALGEEVGTIHSRNEIVQMLELYKSHNALEANEVKMASGVLTFKEKIVSGIMTPVTELFALGIKDVLDERTLLRVFKAGYSRIPVWNEDRSDIVGILFAKDMLLIEARDATPVVAVLNFFRRHPVQAVFNDCPLGELLLTFHSSRQHIAIVRGVVEVDGHDPSYAVVGIVTYEDVIEEIMQEEVMDEHDDDVGVAGGTQLSLLAAAEAGSSLGDAAVSAIAAHLSLNAPVFSTPTGSGARLSLEDIKALVRVSRVVDFVPPPPGWKQPQGALDDAETLYAAGEVSSVCSVLLSGTVTVTFGADALTASLGAWKVIAPGALLAPRYVSDVTVVRASDVVTALRIERSDFAAVIAGGPAGLAGAAAAARASVIAAPRMTRAESIGAGEGKGADTMLARNLSFMGAPGAVMAVTRDRDARLEARRHNPRVRTDTGTTPFLAASSATPAHPAGTPRAGGGGVGGGGADGGGGGGAAGGGGSAMAYTPLTVQIA